MLRKDKKKQRVQQRIITYARQLFADKGYQDTNVADIAHAADIAVGTIYNYYDSKIDIYIDVMASESETPVEDDEVLALAKGEDITDVIIAFLIRAFERFLKYEHKLMLEILKRALSISLSSQLMRRLMTIDLRYIDQLTKLLENAKLENQLPADYDCQLHAECLYSIAVADLMLYIVDDKRSKADMLKRIEMKIRLYFKH